MNNEQVKNAQIILKGLGYEPGRTDGYFSESTEITVKAFQQENQLKMDGKIDGQTAAKLEQAVINELKKEEKDIQLQAAIKYVAGQN